MKGKIKTEKEESFNNLEIIQNISVMSYSRNNASKEKEERVKDVWSLIEDDLVNVDSELKSSKNSDCFTLFVGEKVSMGMLTVLKRVDDNNRGITSI